MLIIKRMAVALIGMACVSGVMAQTATGQRKKTGSGTYVLVGKITDLDSGTVYLSCDDGPAAVLDSATVRDGRFRFAGRITAPLLFHIGVGGLQQAQTGFFMEAGRLTFQASKDSMRKATITGCALNDQWQEWMTTWTRIARSAGPAYRRLDSAVKAGNGKASAPERDAFNEQMAMLGKETDTAVLAFIHKYPASPVGAFVVIDRFINYPDEKMVEKAYAIMGAGARGSVYGRKVKAYMLTASKTAIGARPDFTLTDTSGKSLTLSTLRGKYILVDFWASWCGPCRNENPNVVKAYNEYHAKGFDVVSISLDNNKAAWLKAIDADHLNWHHLSDLQGWKGSLVKDYGIKVIPTNFLLDPSGRVIAKNLRGEELDRELGSAIKEQDFH